MRSCRSVFFHMCAREYFCVMATQLITAIRPVMFSYELQCVEISTTEKTVRFRLLHGTDTLLSEDYAPDSQGRITLYDLNELVEAVIGNAPKGAFAVALGSAAVVEFEVLRCSVGMDCTAEEFLDTRFMTSGTDTRTTAPGRYELLNFYERETAHEVDVMRVLRNRATGEITRESACLVPAGAYSPGTVMSVEVSPDYILAQGDTQAYELVEYTVVCGNRKQRYRVTAAAAADPSVIYRNRFNVWDTYHFAGTLESDPQFERSQAWMNGQYVTYRTQEVMQFKAMTEPVPLGFECYVQDVARSPEIHRLDAAGASRELLTVTDCEIKTVNDDDALNVYTLTYRFADKVSAKAFTGARHRVFDDTFDNSYE